MQSAMDNPTYTCERERLVETQVAPATTRLMADGTLFIDFGKATFGTLEVRHPTNHRTDELTVHLGEKLCSNGRIDREPPGSIRYIRINQPVESGQSTSRITIPPDPRNTGPWAIKMPDYIGEVFPFRYAEIEDAGDINPSHVSRTFVHYPWDDSASSFESSITTEAWDWKYKNNLDWNHAWGAAPANIIPRHLMGIRPLTPGFSRTLIEPHPGGLKNAAIKHPTIRGPVSVDFTNPSDQPFRLEAEIPSGMTACVHLPRSTSQGDDKVVVNGDLSRGTIHDHFIAIESLGSGHHTLETAPS
ncbi:MAG: family 78 glycoside hydrolase catalytic domain [Planctomycetota bacterium]